MGRDMTYDDVSEAAGSNSILGLKKPTHIVKDQQVKLIIQFNTFHFK